MSRPKKNDGGKQIESDYPSITKWVESYGWIEIGDQDWQGFIVRALDEGGLVFEKEGCRKFGDAMAALEKALTKWYEEND